MATQSQDGEKIMRIVLLSLILILILILVGTVWNEVTVKEQQRNRLEDARAICLARGGAILKRPLVLKNQFLVLVGNQWCSVHTLKGPDVADQIKAALTAKP